MTDTIKISRDELQRIAQGCSCEVTTDALDALLATPPADAADMGGQAGEEVEVVAWLSEVRSGNKTVIRASMSETSLEGMRRGYRDENAVIVRDEPCMTVDQHRRILAQHRQQAGKLVEALGLTVLALDQLLPYLSKVPADVGLINEALVAARPLLEK